MEPVKHTFFCSSIESGQLSAEESHHAAQVLRLKTGNVIRLIDGKGGYALAEIRSISKKEVLYDILESEKREIPKPNIVIGIGPTKSMDRFSFFLEKVTEIGCAEIYPVVSQNSERRKLNMDKLRKKLIAAVKQSGNLFLPELHGMISFGDFIKKSDFEDKMKFISHCRKDDDKKELKKSIEKADNYVILVGPEGDFTTEEINLAKEYGFKAVSLGTNILRTETAGIIACHTLHLYSSS